MVYDINYIRYSLLHTLGVLIALNNKISVH